MTTTLPTIDAGRTAIDQIDEQLIALVRQRIEVSRAIQAARIKAGGPRVVHSREGEVCGRWHRELGAAGTTIAMALLDLGRGNHG